MKYLPSRIKDKYEILDIIGEGAYGVVLKAKQKKTDTIVAIKYFKQAPGYKTDAAIIDRELNILHMLRFENIVELIESFRDRKRCCLIFEYVECNMLQVLQQNPEGLPLDHVRRLSYQLFSAIYWCHAHDIIHRDIKPENLLIATNLVLKLCDFGFARFCNRKATTDYYTDYVATRWYRSPELLVGAPYGKPIDVWACGCIMAELRTGQALFAGDSEIDQLYRIQKCLGPLPPKCILTIQINPKFRGLKFPLIKSIETLEQRLGSFFPKDILHLIKNVLHLSDTERMTAEKCIQHDAFLCLNQHALQRKIKRSEKALSSVDTPRLEHNENSQMNNFDVPSFDARLWNSFDVDSDRQTPYRYSPMSTSTRVSENAPDSLHTSSLSSHHQNKHDNNASLTDRSTPSQHRRHPQHHPNIVRASLNNNQILHQPSIMSPRSTNYVNDRIVDDQSNETQPRRPSFESSTQSEIQHAPQLLVISPRPNYASNGVLLRSKQQHSINALQTSSNDSNNKTKRFSFDQQQQAIYNNPLPTPESDIYRSSMILMPSQAPNRHTSSMGTPRSELSAHQHKRDRSNNEILQEQRSPTRDNNQDYHVPLEMPFDYQRSSSRQTQQRKSVSDLIYQFDNQPTVPTKLGTGRKLDQQHLYSMQPWNFEQRKPIYGSDSHLTVSCEKTSSYSRPYYFSNANEQSHKNNVIVSPARDQHNQPINSTRMLPKPCVNFYTHSSTESNHQQHFNNNSTNTYVPIQTALSNDGHPMTPSSYRRQQQQQQPTRVLNTRLHRNNN